MNADGKRGIVLGSPPKTVRRRLAVYISGFDPRGHKFFFPIFRDQLQQHAARKGIAAATGEVEAPPPDKPWLKRWRATLDDGAGEVETVIDFLEWQDLIPRRKRFRFLRTTGAGIATLWDMITKGVFRRLRLYGRSHLMLALYPFVFLVINLAIMAALVVAGLVIGGRHGLGFALLGALAGGLAAGGWYWLTRRLERRTFAWFSLDFWSFQRAQGSAGCPASRSASMISPTMCLPRWPTTASTKWWSFR